MCHLQGIFRTWIILKAVPTEELVIMKPIDKLFHITVINAISDNMMVSVNFLFEYEIL